MFAKIVRFAQAACLVVAFGCDRADQREKPEALKPKKAPIETRALTLNEVKHLEELDRLKKQIDDLFKKTGKMSEQRYYDCVKAVGSQKFCRCLTDQTPVLFSFAEYTSIVIASSDEIEAELSRHEKDDKAQLREAFEKTLKARDLCVAKFSIP